MLLELKLGRVNLSWTISPSYFTFCHKTAVGLGSETGPYNEFGFDMIVTFLNPCQT